MDFSSQTEAYERWLVDDKKVVFSPKVKIHDFRKEGQGRGLIAVDDISKEEVLFTIPRDSVLAFEDDVEFVKAAEEFGLDAWPALIAYMLLKQGSVEWKPYFDILPDTFTTPMFWETEDIESKLKGSDVIDKIGKDSAENMYRERILPFVERYSDKFGYDKADTSIEAFHRMGSLIMSYSFDIANPDATGDEDEELPAVKAMIPPADVLNAHSRLCNAHLETDDDGSLQMVATENISKGNQVYNTYGAVPNCDLLRCYGYVEIGGTEYDLVEIDASMVTELAENPDFAAQQERDFMESSHGSEIYDESYTINAPGDPDPEFAVFVMYLNLPSIESEDRNNVVKRLAKMFDRDSIITEEAKQHFVAIFSKRLERYDQGVIDEARATKDAPPTDEVTSDADAMAREVLLDEARILLKALSWAETSPTISNHDFLSKHIKNGARYIDGHANKKARS